MKFKNTPSSSLIISTYNWPEALNLCLTSVLRQSMLPDEIIIADDGSTADTRILIEQFQKKSAVPIVHVWQEDEGFQLSRIRNKAIAKAKYAYIIQIDGDLILHKNFIKDHLSFCQPSYFVTGSRVMLSQSYSTELIKRNSINISLIRKGVKSRTNGIRSILLRNLFKNYKADDIYYLRGCNMAFWKKDLLMINGYNEDMKGWGREDNEIAARLINAGIKKRVIKYSAIVFHIFHPEKERNSVEVNDRILQDAIQQNLLFIKNGIKK